MYYPWLDVPALTAPMLIAIIAILHVIVSHYAVGGGILLARENRRALKRGDDAYRSYWKKHAKFFIMLTVPYGAITGVGIWFTIGLASPLATETLIRTFVFGWAIEWCFFLLEIVSAFALYYFWDRMGRKASVFVGWIYAFSAWISLVLITGITSFMLNSSGLIEDWESTGDFWHAFLNEQFVPQTIVRTGCALTLGTFYVMLHAAFRERNFDVREMVVKRMRVPAFVGLFLIAAGVAGWAYYLPESARLTLERAAATNIFVGLFVAILLGIALLLVVGPCARPRETSPGFALALLLMGFAGVGAAEFAREAVRKPYVVDRVVYGHQIYRGDVARLRRNGYLYEGVWTSLVLEEMQERYPDLKISAERYLGRPSSHLEPPSWATAKETVPEENATEESGAPAEGTLEEQSPENAPLGDVSQAEGATEFYWNTVAYQQANDGSRFTPASTLGSSSGYAAIPAAPQQTSTPTRAPRQTQNGLPNASLGSNPNPGGVPARGTANALPAVEVASPRTNNAPANVGPAVQPNVAPQTRADNPAGTPATQTQIPAATSTLPAGTRAMSARGEDQGVNAIATSSVAPPATVVDASALEEESVEPIKSPAELDLEVNGPIARGNDDLLKVEEDDRLALGRMMFLHHCNACHASTFGYSAVAPMIAGKSADELAQFAKTLNHSHFYMPPWSGTEVEAELLAEYLVSISPKTPSNVFMKDKPKKEKPKAPAENDETQGQTPEEAIPDGATSETLPASEL